MTGRAVAHRTAPLDVSAAWELLRSVRSAADAAAAGLGCDPDGRWRWRDASPEADALADRYVSLCLAGPLFTFAQLGQSLDGFIASRTGDADYVTGEEDREHLHRLRALADAVVIGAGTAVADDPRLTVRACTGAHPVRVVIDPYRRVPRGHQVFTDGSAPTLWVVGADADEAAETGRGADERAPGPRRDGRDGGGVGAGVEVLTLRDRAAFAPRRLVRELARRGLGRVLVEGGGVTVSRFLREGALHRLYVTVAPVLLGDGVPGLRFTGPERMRDALRPPTRRAVLGEDTLFELDLRAPRPGEPGGDENTGPGQGGDEGENPVHHGYAQPLGGAQSRRTEGPRGDALPGAPAADVQR
ncbi:RibD family protein [Streptomyces corynorhini]|uniref:Deaminase n=1 Tax=Streptomyces corynorhini TaxID=2282652 RepID=A0A370B6G6_9ACTN|nr:RibD family protein [Streptomyces corynorhini]RDG35674.1 deaminase [Streptomyces corynorhini]